MEWKVWREEEVCARGSSLGIVSVSRVVMREGGAVSGAGGGCGIDGGGGGGGEGILAGKKELSRKEDV